jgi:predicted RND superfamily exporter protein
MLMNVASFQAWHGAIGALAAQYPTGVRCRCRRAGPGSVLGGAEIDKVIAADRPAASTAISVVLSGQVDTMRESYNGLFSGMALAVVLVYLFLVINFQSWLDPLIVLMAVPFALGGVMWMLYLTGTHLSVPALMGTLMCIGLTTANSILVVTFANQRMAAGDDAVLAAATAGYTRCVPVLMTAGAMILGMIPMALGVGEGGEQNAPLARAVIGGLLFATFATLVFVPTVYPLLRRRHAAAALRIRRKEIPLPSNDMGARLQRAAVAVAVVLLLAFLIVHFTKSHTEHGLCA